MKADLLGPSGRPRLENDAYHTIDPLAVKTLAEVMQLYGLDVWEPAAGLGHMARDLTRQGAQVTASDLHAHPDPVFAGIHTGQDFFAREHCDADAIITNPPFNQTVEFIEHALKLCPEGSVAMLLRHEWICRKNVPGRDRLALWVPIRGRLRWFAEGGRPRHNFAWGVWMKPDRGSCRLVI